MSDDQLRDPDSSAERPLPKDHDDDAAAPKGQVSEGGNSTKDKETSQGGADAVPDSHG